MRILRAAFVLAVLTTPCHVSAQEDRPTIFVGAPVRQGFLDIDAGTRDSIQDVQAEFKQGNFVLTTNREEAVLVLLVLARGIVTNGSVGFSSASAVGGIGSGFGFVTPNTVPTLTTLLRVGTYEKALQSEGPTWTRAAKAVAQDVLAWWAANEAAVRKNLGAK